MGAKPLFQEHVDEVPEGESAIHRGIPKQYRWPLREHGVDPLKTHLMTRLLPPVDELPKHENIAHLAALGRNAWRNRIYSGTKAAARGLREGGGHNPPRADQHAQEKRGQRELPPSDGESGSGSLVEYWSVARSSTSHPSAQSSWQKTGGSTPWSIRACRSSRTGG